MMSVPVFVGCLLLPTQAFLPRNVVHVMPKRTVLRLSFNNHQDDAATSRRAFLTSCGVVLAGNTVPLGSPANAAISQEEKDKKNLLKGYERLNYLLDNWEKETTVCTSDNPYTGCDRTPIKVMEYLGYKSMDDPLFKADKTMRRLEALVPAADEVDYLEAMEKWAEKADEGSGMAYVSSWGEANPGGGKDRVAYFIERSKNDVIACRDSLGTVLRILGLL
eukprot:CAMPEP_0116869668 /NCGR_PEP_ID=MMETSP0418-20121206/27885_1 /TAXON_ID=1158023 /ORGANISM="Astrosyne radiata, Strain 13vi08-1A" /LENGTH=219 /DNA_ID=CAMNT_0004505785 /DNA_START=285 /DNA_END=944 /DNA_ORIENTATION=-